MAGGDQRDRVARLWEQQRDALEQAMGRAQKRGRQVAEGVADAVRRITPDTDTRGVLERIESQQREFITRWAEMQRETFDRLLETNEAFWDTVKGALDRGGRRSTPKKATKAVPTGPAVSVNAKSASKKSTAKKTAAKKSTAKKPAAKRATTKKSAT